MTTQSKSVSQVKSEVSNQERTLVELILREKVGDDLPFIREFRQQHAKVTAETKKLQERHAEVANAAESLGKQEAELAQTNKTLANQRAGLEKLCRPLGEAAFGAFQAGQVQHHESFDARQKLEEHLDELRSEHQSLAPKSDAGVVDKTKAGAQQLVVAGKIKLEETKLGGLHKQIGKDLIAANAEDDVQCESTSEVLEQVRLARTSIEKGRSEVNRVESELNSTKEQFGQSFGIPVESKRTLDAETARCRTIVADLDHQLQSIVSTLCQEAAANQQSVADEKLRSVLQSIRQTQADLSVAQKQQSETNAKRLRIGLIGAGVAGAGFLVLMVLCCGIFGIMSVFFDTAAAKEVAAANELWESGKQADAATKYRSLIDSSWAFVDESDKATVLQRTVDFDAQNGNESSANSLIERALSEGITLSLESQEAQRLVAQVERTRREAEEKRQREEEEQLAAERKRKEQEERLVAEQKQKDAEVEADEEPQKKTYTVKRGGFFSGSIDVELTPTVDAAISLTNIEYRFPSLQFDLKYVEYFGYTSWDFTAYDKNGVVLNTDSISHPTMKVGQTVRGTMFIPEDDCSRIVVHYPGEVLLRSE